MRIWPRGGGCVGPFAAVGVWGVCWGLVDFVYCVGGTSILRSLRDVSDFVYECQKAGMNRNLHTEGETLFLTPAEQYLFMSSRIVR